MLWSGSRCRLKNFLPIREQSRLAPLVYHEFAHLCLAARVSQIVRAVAESIALSKEDCHPEYTVQRHLANVSMGETRGNRLRASWMMEYQWCAGCLLYTSDAADDLLCVDLGGRRIIKKKKKTQK